VPDRHPPAALGRVALVVAAALLAGACTGTTAARRGGPTRPTASTSTTTTTVALEGPAPMPAPSARAAVEGLLAAEQGGDHAASFLLLSTASRQQFKTVDSWARRRRQLPAVTGFTVEVGSDPDTAVALVQHTPGLDPFVGLSPARERQTWRGRHELGGVLVDAEPDRQPVLPPDDAAPGPVVAWAQAVQACDEAKAKALQAVPDLFGSSAGAAHLCRSQGTVAVGEVGRLSPGPASADIVAQYGGDALGWARTVLVTGPVTPFRVVVAPIGDSWEVMGVFD